MVTFTLKIVEALKGTYWLHSTPILEALQYDMLTNTSLEWSFQDSCQMASKSAGHPKQ